MSVLIKVNDKEMLVRDALRLSELTGDSVFKVAEEMLLAQKYGAENGISNSKEEVQKAFDEFRHLQGLESVENFNQWLFEEEQTLLSVQNYIDFTMIKNKISSSIPDDDIQTYFNEHKLEFDAVEIYSLRVETEELAQELYSQIVDDDEDFCALAVEHSTDAETSMKGGYVGELKRAEMSGEIEAAVFSASAGDVIGPVKTEKGYNLFKTINIFNAELGDEEEQIVDILYETLIAKLKDQATVEYPVYKEQ